MSRNRNKRDKYRVSSGGTPVAELLLEVERDSDGDDADTSTALNPTLDSSAPSDTISKGIDASITDTPAPSNGDTSETPDFTLFIPISKIDEATHQVWGRGAQEVPDLTGEILDWASSRPYIRTWSEDTFKRSQGKSKGNIRAMHQPIAAGKLLDLSLNDAEKAADLGTEIVDDQEWKKCVKGVYTGFSMGGKYVRRWQDPANPSLTRYTGRPTEFSLVDAPAIPTATFKLIKANGEVELHKFVNVQKDNGVAALPSAPTSVTTNIGDIRVANMPSAAPAVRIDPTNATTGNVLAVQSNPNATALPDFATEATPAMGIAQQQPDAAGKIDAAERMLATLALVDRLLAAGKNDEAEQHMRSLIYHKVAADAPNLHAVGANADQSCGNCIYRRMIDSSAPYCTKYDFATRDVWMCDTWQKITIGVPDPAAVGAAIAPAMFAGGQPASPPAAKLDALTQRGEQVGILRKLDALLEPPQDQSIDPRHYADPANWGWCCDTTARAEQCITDYNKRLRKESYAVFEWAVLGRRIARLAEAVSGKPYRYDSAYKQIGRARVPARLT